MSPACRELRVDGMVEAAGTSFAFTKARLRVEVDGVAVDFAEMSPAEPNGPSSDLDQVAVLLVNALGRAPHLIDPTRRSA